MSPSKLLSFSEALALQTRLHEVGFDVVKTENLYNFNGEPGFAAVHG
ncbi:MAG: isocitrate dehydrogenase [Glaciecola sp.]|jgi:isocitrate dehydrogenase